MDGPARVSSRRAARRVTRTIFKLVSQSPIMTARLLREPLIKAELERAARAETVDADDPMTRVLLDTGLLRCRTAGGAGEAEAPTLAEAMHEARLADAVPMMLHKTYHPRAFVRVCTSEGDRHMTPARRVYEDPYAGIDMDAYYPGLRRNTEPWYPPDSPAYSPCSPAYSPTSPAGSPTSPAYEARHYTGESPVYSPASPSYSPASPAGPPPLPPYEARHYTGEPPVYSPTSPCYEPSAPAGEA